MRRRFTWLAACAAALLLQLGAAPESQAVGVTNGSFESGTFEGWAAIGVTSIATASFGSGPTEGNYQALLTNGTGSVSDAALEAFLGVPAGTLDALSATLPGSPNAIEGSAIKQSITVNAGDTVSFDFNFLTNENPPTFFNDFAFVVTQFSTALSHADAAFLPSLTVFNLETGFQTFSETMPSSGTFSLGIGIVDAGDAFFDAALLIDRVSVTSGGMPIPEGGTLLLFGTGMAGIAALRRRCRKEPSTAADET